jgi:hypothetical protein
MPEMSTPTPACAGDPDGVAVSAEDRAECAPTADAALARRKAAKLAKRFMAASRLSGMMGGT